MYESKRTWMGSVLGILVGLPLIHIAHQGADRQRFKETHNEERFFLPNPEVTQALSLGQQTMVSDFLWIRTVLLFADFAWDCQDREARWLVSMLRTMTVLDPSWRTLYMYGGNMLGVCNKVEEADAIFELGHQNLPEEYYFPFSLAMNAYQEHKDYEAAEQWMRIAVTKEGAPSWYRAAMAGVIDKKGQREASIRYLEDELQKELSPSVRDITEERLRLLRHELYTEMLQQQKNQLELELGYSVWDVDLLSIEYSDPWEEGWLISPDGVIRSVEMERRQAKKTQKEERRRLKRSTP